MVDAAQRLAELDGILTDLLREAHLLGELPQAYRLVPLPLDELKVAAKALAWAREAPNPEGWPPVYALFLQGREVEIGAQAAPEPEAGSPLRAPSPFSRRASRRGEAHSTSTAGLRALGGRPLSPPVGGREDRGSPTRPQRLLPAPGSPGP